MSVSKANRQTVCTNDT